MGRPGPKARSAAGRLLLLAAVLAGLCRQAVPTACLPAARPADPAYLFLSANTDEGLTLAEASRRLRGPAQGRFRRVAGDLLREVGAGEARVHDALGDWSDGVENSLLAEVPRAPDLSALRCAAGRFGLLADQKTVLAFRPGEGPDGVSVLDVPERDVRRLRVVLDRHGVALRTIVPRRGGHRVVVYHEGRRLGPALAALGTRYAVPVRTTRGTGEVLGGPTRAAAQERYREAIRAYEARRRPPAGTELARQP